MTGIMGSDLANLDFDFSSEDSVSCFLCEEFFEVSIDPQPMLQHLLHSHKFVIGSYNEIADFRQYLLYWDKLRFLDLKDYCIVYLTNTEPGAKDLSETFYLLCDKLSEDKDIRKTIREMKLKYLTQQKEEECRNKFYSRKCIYCQVDIEGGVSNSFHHLTFDHGFSLGNPDNIVFGSKLLDILEEKLHKLQCLFCEKIFKNHNILREHMRKKQHRSLNPKNKIYDKFYFLNYLKPGIPWEEAKKVIHDEKESHCRDSEPEATSDDENHWTDWREDSNVPATCLFCQFTTSKVPSGLLFHMSECHQFDFDALTKSLSFYSKVKLINFIRTKNMANECPNCSLKFSCNLDLLHHMGSMNHFYLPESNIWDHPRYLIPFNENDGLLFHLEDMDVYDEDTSSSASFVEEEFVFPEEILALASTSVLGDKKLREEITVGVDRENLYYTYACLFCSFSKSGYHGRTLCISHMNSMHNFDFNILPTSNISQLTDFVNYIRLMTHYRQCYVCHKPFLTKSALEEHRILEEHTAIPSHIDIDKYKSLIQDHTSTISDGFLLEESRMKKKCST